MAIGIAQQLRELYCSAKLPEAGMLSLRDPHSSTEGFFGSGGIGMFRERKFTPDSINFRKHHLVIGPVGRLESGRHTR